MSLWDWLFGKGEHKRRKGPAHSSDRHGFWKDLWQVRRVLRIDPDHSGSVDIYDHFGCPPYNDNEVKRQRRGDARPVLLAAFAITPDDELRQHVQSLLSAFQRADELAESGAAA